MKQPRPLRENRKHGDLLFPVSAYETKMEEDFQMPLSYHWHPEIEIFFITSGKANFQVEAEQFVICLLYTSWERKTVLLRKSARSLCWIIF